MYRIERRGSEWVVLKGDQVVSVHRSRREAERAVDWLLAHNHESAPPVRPESG